ncbi:MAG: RNA-binding protein [Firmicutes bacterium HGW-Firmicutes-1]|jgi:ribosome-associated protein|nr:MAG: RNA-binding protein [Firmicutes bacterium HGW-Firmicutes-1]
MKKIKIDTEFIKLGQLLKLAGIADSGVHAKILILNGEVKLNGAVEMQRGKKIVKGDVIELIGHSLKVE